MSADGQPFTEQDDAAIRVFYPTEGAVGLSTRLNRSPRSINRRARALNPESPRAWSTEDKAVVLEFYPQGGAPLVASRLASKRTHKAIGLMAKRLGLHADALLPGTSWTPGTVPSNRDGWSEKEDELLRRHAGTVPLKRIFEEHFASATPRRTYAAVAQRLSALGLTKPRLPPSHKATDPSDLVPALHITAPMRDEIRSLVCNGSSLSDLLKRFPRLSPLLLRQLFVDFATAARGLADPMDRTQGRTLTPDEQAIRAEFAVVRNALTQAGVISDSALPRYYVPANLETMEPAQASVAATLRLLAALRVGSGIRPCLEEAIPFATPANASEIPLYLSYLVQIAAIHQLADSAAMIALIERLWDLPFPARSGDIGMVTSIALMALDHIKPGALPLFFAAREPRGRYAEHPDSFPQGWCSFAAPLACDTRMRNRELSPLLRDAPFHVLAAAYRAAERRGKRPDLRFITRWSPSFPAGSLDAVKARVVSTSHVDVFSIPGGFRYAIKLPDRSERA